MEAERQARAKVRSTFKEDTKRGDSSVEEIPVLRKGGGCISIITPKKGHRGLGQNDGWFHGGRFFLKSIQEEQMMVMPEVIS